jgi:prefoldin alpha subunit
VVDDMENEQDNRADAEEIMMQLRYLQNIYAQEYENIENNIATYTLTNAAINRNIELLEKSKEIEGARMMIGGEGGAYVPAAISKIENVLTYVGAGYMIEKPVEKALEFLRENGKRGDEILSKLNAEKRKIEQNLIDIQYKSSALQSQLTGTQE